MSEDNPILRALIGRKPSVEFANLTPGLPFKWEVPTSFGDVVCLKLCVSNPTMRVATGVSGGHKEVWTPLEGSNIGLIFIAIGTCDPGGLNVIPL